MSYIDIILLSITAASIYNGYSKGAILALLSLIAWVLCLVVSQDTWPWNQWVYQITTEHLANHYDHSLINNMTQLFLFAASLLALNFIFKLLGILLIFTKLAPGVLNNYLGAGVGTVQAVVIILIAGHIITPISNQYIDLGESAIFNWIAQSLPQASQCITQINQCLG